MNNLEIIDIKPLADVSISLLDRLERAVGWAVTPKGKRKDFDEAVNYLVEEIKNNDTMPPLVKAVQISNARRTIKEYKNQYDVVQIAIDNMGGDILNKVDDDWLVYFMNQCRNVSNDQIKIMFGKLLSDECKSSGLVEKSLIHALSIMSAEEAKAFACLSKLLFNCRTEYGEETIIIIANTMDILNEIGITYEHLVSLSRLGLIEAKAKYPEQYALVFGTEEKVDIELEYHNEKLIISCLNGSFPYGMVLLTQNGITLMKALQPQKLDGYMEKVKKIYGGTKYLDFKIEKKEVKVYDY